jgi:hypothetical protein
MPGTRYWLSFDISLTASYEKLYAWLDEQGAEECGDNLATFEHPKGFDPLAKELSSLLTKGSRAYLIGKQTGREPKRMLGRFILGRRKAPPWAGFGSIQSSDERDEG